MRIVLDAAVLVRAHPRSGSAGRNVLAAVLEGEHTLLLSNALIAETTRVLRYPRLQKIYALTDSEIYDYAQFLQEASEIVVIDAAYQAPLRDANDLDVMQTAERGEGKILCTNDNDFQRTTHTRLLRPPAASKSTMRNHCWHC